MPQGVLISSDEARPGPPRVLLTAGRSACPVIVEPEAGRADLELETVQAAGRVVGDLLDDLVLVPEGADGTDPADLVEVGVAVAADVVRQPALTDARAAAVELAVAVAVGVAEPVIRPLHLDAVVDPRAGLAVVLAIQHAIETVVGPVVRARLVVVAVGVVADGHRVAGGVDDRAALDCGTGLAGRSRCDAEHHCHRHHSENQAETYCELPETEVHAHVNSPFG